MPMPPHKTNPYDLQHFKKTNFLSVSKQHQQQLDSVAEALFYFFSNQFDKITASHSLNLSNFCPNKKIERLIKPALVLDSIEAIRSDQLTTVKMRLAQLIADCNNEYFAVNMTEAAVTGKVCLTSPFSDGHAHCQESYEVKGGPRGLSGGNCLRFTDGQACFFIFQFASSCDGIYFPLDNVLISLAHVHVDQVKSLQKKLLAEFAQIIGYAQANNSFGGLIATHFGGPAHFYYENWPVLFEIHAKPDLYPKIPAVILRKGHDYNDLDLLFGHHRHVLLSSDEIDATAFRRNQWFFMAGTNRHLHRNAYCFEVADRYLVEKALKSPSPTALTMAKAIEGRYPLVWIGVEGQKRCWLEQVDGYAYILNQLARRYPNMGVVIDGWTAPFSPSQHAATESAKDRVLGQKIAHKLPGDIPYLLLMGENSNTKLTIGNNADFFITNFATGSMHISRLLGKPGFCHLSGELSNLSLRFGMQIHPNRHVFLLPKRYVHDRSLVAPSLSATCMRLFFMALNRLSLNTIKYKKTPHLGQISYSIDKKAFFGFIEQRLDIVLTPPEPVKLRFFMEPSFSIHPEVRHYLKMASYGNLLEVFPTLPPPKIIADLKCFSQRFLECKLIYGVFPFGGHHILRQPGEYLLWLGDPFKRIQLHTLQFIKNAAAENQTATVNAVLKAEHKALDNYYTRLLSGQDAAFGECSEQMLATAITNLSDHFMFIGLNEQQTQSFDRLCALMDWDRSLFPDCLNQHYEIEDAAFSDADRQLAEDLIQFDRRLYAAALAIIGQKWPGNSVSA